MNANAWIIGDCMFCGSSAYARHAGDGFPFVYFCPVCDKEEHTESIPKWIYPLGD